MQPHTCTSSQKLLNAMDAVISLLLRRRKFFIASNLWPPNSPISILWIVRSGLSCSVVSTTDKPIVWMNWNGGSSMSGAVLNSRFLPCDAMHSAAIAITRCPSVCPSVCLSRSWVAPKRIKISSKFFHSPSGSQAILVFPYQTGWRYSDGNPPNGGVECKAGMKILTIFDQYLAISQKRL